MSGFAATGTDPTLGGVTGTIPDAIAQGVLSAEYFYLNDADAERIYLGEVTPTGAAMLRVASTLYITATTDTPANTPYTDRLVEPYNLTIQVPRPDETGEGGGSFTFGVVALESSDGALDSRLVQAIEGATYTCKVGGKYHRNRVGESELPFAQYITVMRAVVDGIEWDQGRLLLSLREAVLELDQPVQPNTYAGTGGLEGGDSLAGSRKPLAFGELINIEPVLVDPVNLVYQWHDGDVEAVDALRDQGAAFDAGDYYGDVADITTVTPAAGEWATQNSGGYIKLGAAPFGRITLTGRGSNDGGYVNTIPDIALRLCTDHAGAGLGDDIDLGSFASFEPIARPAGYYLRGDSAPTLRDVLTDLLGSADGWVSNDRLGRITIGRNLNPDAETPIVTLTDDNVIEIEQASALPPVWRVEVGYARNFAVQDPDGLVATLTAEERELYSNPSRTAEAEDASVKTSYVNARELRIESLLAEKSDAEALADEILTRLKVRRRIVSARKVLRSMFVRRPGDVVRIVSTAAGLDAGENYVLHSLSEVAGSEWNDWELWG